MPIKEKLRAFIPDRYLLLAAVLSAVLGMLSFPDFGIDFLIFLTLTPMLLCIALRPSGRAAAFTSGWVFGFLYFFLTCWWLAHAPIQYASVNPLIAYSLVAVACAIAGFFPALFLVAVTGLVNRIGGIALVAAPFLWMLTDLLRYQITGNNWNALGYALAFSDLVGLASIGGLASLTFLAALFSVAVALLVLNLIGRIDAEKSRMRVVTATSWILVVASVVTAFVVSPEEAAPSDRKLRVVTVQPNVPMDGLNTEQYRTLLEKHLRLAGEEIRKAEGNEDLLVVFPESPMLFRYGMDEGLRSLFARYTLTNGISLMFNSTEWTADSTGVTNSALVVGPAGRLSARYDKYHLLPFGEFSPLPGPLGDLMPSFVGSFTPGLSVEPVEVGDLRAGVMICFESHFGSLGRSYATAGADFLIELTNDGYLGETPVLRQHLANSVVRAVETGLPLVRSTNVGITALILPTGEIVDEAPVYEDASRQWVVTASDRSPTPYTRFGDLFFWFCSSIGLALSFVSLRKGRASVPDSRK